MSQTAFFAVCNVNGPVSVEIIAESVDDAVAQFERLDKQDAIDNASSDADDALDIDGNGMSESEFETRLTDADCSPVRDLSPCDGQGNGGWPSHEAGGWMLWRKD